MSWPYTHRDRPRVVVAGGGVAALEACLALRARLSDEDLEIVLLATEPRFAYRPLAVLEPFVDGAGWSLRLEDFAADCDVTLVDDALVAVGASARQATTASGHELDYDALLVAIGARAVPAVPGALTFRGPGDVRAFRELIEEQAREAAPAIAFACPTGPSWPLPLYELALMTATELRERGADPAITFATPDAAPLSIFGQGASEFIAGLFRAEGIELIVDADPVRAGADGLELHDGRRVPANRVVAMPRVAGRRVGGLTQDDDDFLPVDQHCRVAAANHVYAAGDVTAFPLKHGSLAAQQADAAAEAILAELGLPIVPRPFRPVLQGVLHNRQEPAYLQHAVGAGKGRPPRPYALWWPPSKIAGRHLSPYLTIQAGAPRMPEWDPSAKVLAVEVDVSELSPGRS